MNDIVAELMDAYADPFSTDRDPRHLLKLAAEEIKRLRLLIQDYAAICKSSAEEIRQLRER